MSVNQMFQQKLTELKLASQPHDILGSIREEFDISAGVWKTYKCVILKLVPTADVDVVAGDALCYTAFENNEVGVDIDDIQANLPAGIALGAIDMSEDKGKVIWIQIQGLATVAVTVATSALAGDDFNMGSTGVADKTFTLAVPADTKRYAGTLIHAANKLVYLDCPR